MEDMVTLERVPLHRVDNLYVMKAWIKRDPEHQGNSGPPFAGPV